MSHTVYNRQIDWTALYSLHSFSLCVSLHFPIILWGTRLKSVPPSPTELHAFVQYITFHTVKMIYFTLKRYVCSLTKNFNQLKLILFLTRQQSWPLLLSGSTWSNLVAFFWLETTKLLMRRASHGNPKATLKNHEHDCRLLLMQTALREIVVCFMQIVGTVSYLEPRWCIFLKIVYIPYK